MGVSGAATVLDVSPCPELETGEGRLVTGTFLHTSADIIDLQIEGQQTAISCTGNHPFWSEDRQEFIEARELQNGERLRRADGSLTSLVSIISRASQVDVYNLEVWISTTPTSSVFPAFWFIIIAFTKVEKKGNDISELRIA